MPQVNINPMEALNFLHAKLEASPTLDGPQRNQARQSYQVLTQALQEWVDFKTSEENRKAQAEVDADLADGEAATKRAIAERDGRDIPYATSEKLARSPR